MAAVPKTMLGPAAFAAEQARVRRELDPETGRWRLIRGTGEVIEEIVSRERQAEINRAATAADGAAFSARIYGQAALRRG